MKITVETEENDICVFCSQNLATQQHMFTQMMTHSHKVVVLLLLCKHADSSALEPILFILYVNDLCDVASKFASNAVIKLFVVLHLVVSFSLAILSASRRSS